MRRIYEGDDNVNFAKLQILRTKFEGLKMSEEKRIADYLLRVDEIVNSIKGSREVKDSIIIKNLSSSMSFKYEPKISIVEEAKDIDKLTLDELHGIFTTYEMNMGNAEPSKKETTFKAAKKEKSKSPKK